MSTSGKVDEDAQSLTGSSASKRPEQTLQASLHDILIITPDDDEVPEKRRGLLFQVPVGRKKEELYKYTQRPQHVVGSAISQANYNAERKVRGITRPRNPNRPDAPTSPGSGTRAERDRNQGIAFATLPNRESPTPSEASCYLIDARSLNYSHAWAKETWSVDEGEEEADDQGKGRSRPTRTVGVLLAVGASLIEVTLREDGKRGHYRYSGERTWTKADFSKHPDVWYALRNGAVVGTALQSGGLPKRLVNLSAFGPRINVHKETSLRGTLDFKWTPGQRIRIKFKSQPSASVLKEFQKAAAEWTRDANIRLEVPTSENAIHHGTESSWDDYDVLVSLKWEDLKTDRERLMYAPKDGPIPPPKSQLGRYCRRVAEDVTTMWLGRAEGLRNLDGTEFTDDDEYFNSDVFKSFLRHELGHALGLPHIQGAPMMFNGDTPKLPPEDQDDPTGIGMVAEFNNDRHAKFLGSEEWSEWPEGLGAMNSTELAELAKKAIMLGLPFRRVEGAVVYQTEVSDYDRKWLKQLYQFDHKKPHRWPSRRTSSASAAM